MSDDERLLQQLAQAFVPEPVEPSDEEIAALRRAVSRRFGERPAPRPFWALPRWVREPAEAVSLAGRRPAAMLLAAAALAAGVAVVARARVSSTEAQAVALTADSPELVQTREAMASVRDALAARDKESVERTSAELRQHLEHLGDGDRRAVGREAPVLLRAADAFVVTVVIDQPGPLVVKLKVAPKPGPTPEPACEDPYGDADPEACQPQVDPYEDVEEPEQAEHGEQAQRDRERAQRDEERAQRDRERAQRDRERAQRDRERAQHDREQAQRDRERAQYDAQRAQYEARRAQYEAQRTQYDAQRTQYDAERGRESIAREAEKARREALKAAAKAREEGMREAAKARAEAMRDAMQEAAKARGEALQEAAKVRAEAIRKALKEAAKAREKAVREAQKAAAKVREDAERRKHEIRTGPIRIELHEERHEGHTQSPRRDQPSEKEDLENE